MLVFFFNFAARSKSTCVHNAKLADLIYSMAATETTYNNSKREKIRGPLF